MKTHDLVCIAALPPLLFLFACVGGQSGTLTDNADSWGCVNSQWGGELSYGGDWFDVQACLGIECSSVERVSIIHGTSCYVPAELPPPDVERPSSAGPPMEDISHSAISDGEGAEFRVCAHRSPTAGDGGADDVVRLDVVIVTLERPAEDSIPEQASLRVIGGDGTVLVETELDLNIPDGHVCPGFSVDLDGNTVGVELDE